MHIILNKFLVLITSNKLAYLYLTLLSCFVHYDIDSKFICFNELLISVNSDF
jgi:hypothetical protein